MNKLYIVGIGPGAYEDMTIKADRALKECDIIVGYNVYIDLVSRYYPDKEFYKTGMTGEVERCKAALDFAKSGKTTAIVCSGDGGIYGMAGLVFELRGKSDELKVEVIGGLTAAISGGSILGAPLTDDFCTISLSDRITSIEDIEKRLAKAAEADFNIVLYNPASKSRPDYLSRACDILLKYLPKERICGVVRNIGRDGQEKTIMTLGELKSFKADMFCTVFIGSGRTSRINDMMVTKRGYKDA